MIKYDEDIMQKSASRLHNQAEIIVGIYSVGATLVGGSSGYFLAGGSIGGVLVGAIALGLIGFWVGDSKAFVLRLVAQAALCQVQIERNTRVAVGGIKRSSEGLIRTALVDTRGSLDVGISFTLCGRD